MFSFFPIEIAGSKTDSTHPELFIISFIKEKESNVPVLVVLQCVDLIIE